MAERQKLETKDEKNVSILQPKNDIVFQTLFSRGEESITKAILEDILKIEIEKLDLDKTKELLNDNQEDKNGRLDLRAVINDNIECDIELQWMMFLENPEDMEVKKIMENNEDIKEAKNELDKISMDEALRRRVLNQQIAEMDRKQFLDDAHEDGYNEGVIEGIIEAKIDIIKKLIEENMEINKISKITGFSEKR